jgi:L-alanine-DL-glutamate epimerase-like enolase superfamily enzyme
MSGVRTRTIVRGWTLREPFVIARGAIERLETLCVTLTDPSGHVGCGEGHPVDYAGETIAAMQAAVDAVAPALAAGADRRDLLSLMPAGGARNAVDAALWDLSAKRGEGDPFAANGLSPQPVVSARTLGIRSPARFETAARDTPAHWLKIKVDAEDPIAMIAAVRRGAPDARLIVDPNQSWSVPRLKALAPRLVPLGVELLEQPIPVGAEAELDGWSSPVPLCADELVETAADLARAAGRFQAVNIKLDKAGGLTAALDLADAAAARGLALMVGCMGGPSLTMAPGMVLAQRCAWVDLDGPLFLDADDPGGFEYTAGVVHAPHLPDLWG